ncbi:hypothetical protein BLNAU_8454 [Blattamonas nauphoetae]|uniref:Uncharacterized protein n=1 Tax=Blattamonas nauphoetae TaxID=2049346 RepID=A0ABQ9XYS5_9EUKA|nr:hypothetical protein BLNAU_8454 [Blattamonas nauphoetae]
MKLQPIFDDSLEAKAVNVLEFVTPDDRKSADSFLSSFGQTTKESSRNFVQSIVVLVSSVNLDIITAAMELLRSLIGNCSAYPHHTLVKADLIRQLIVTLNPLSLSFAEAEDIHTCLIQIIYNSVWLSTPTGLRQLQITDGNVKQAVHETILKKVLVPSEKYICHLCVSRFSIVDGTLSETFLELLARLLEICPYYQRTLDSVLHMPVVLTIPSYLTFFEDDESIWGFLSSMVDTQRKWNRKMETNQQTWKIMQRVLRMEGIEDVIEEKLQNDQNEYKGGWIVNLSIEWNNLQGMNFRYHE